jgi:hypothetical protein
MDDVLVLIFKDLDCCDLLRCSYVCKVFYKATKNDMLWEMDNFEPYKLKENNFETYKFNYGTGLLPKKASDIIKIVCIKENNFETFKFNYGLNILSKKIDRDNVYYSRVINLDFLMLGRLPKQLGLLENLNILACASNCLESIPIEIFNLKNLSILLLEHNILRSIPTQIGNLKNLCQLALHNNKLKTLPDELSTLPKLTRISYYNNKNIVIPLCIKKMKGLEIITGNFWR